LALLLVKVVIVDVLLHRLLLLLCHLRLARAPGVPAHAVHT
jgi:hypothetical protein